METCVVNGAEVPLLNHDFTVMTKALGEIGLEEMPEQMSGIARSEKIMEINGVSKYPESVRSISDAGVEGVAIESILDKSNDDAILVNGYSHAQTSDKNADIQNGTTLQVGIDVNEAVAENNKEFFAEGEPNSQIQNGDISKCESERKDTVTTNDTSINGWKETMDNFEKVEPGFETEPYNTLDFSNEPGLTETDCMTPDLQESEVSSLSSIELEFERSINDEQSATNSDSVRKTFLKNVDLADEERPAKPLIDSGDHSVEDIEKQEVSDDDKRISETNNTTEKCTVSDPKSKDNMTVLEAPVLTGNTGVHEENEQIIAPEGNLLLFRVSKILNGPVHKAFLYVYSQTYTQSTNVYTYVSENIHIGRHFNAAELSAFKRDKRPASYSLPLLFKVIRFCCQPTLAQHDSSLWTLADSQNLSIGIENLLAVLMKIYDETSKLEPLTREGYDERLSEIRDLTVKLVEATGRHDVTGRWGEALEVSLRCFDDICSGGNLASCPAELTADVKMELKMRYQLLTYPKLRPDLLHLTTTTPSLVQEGKDSLIPDEVKVNVTNIVKNMRENEYLKITYEKYCHEEEDSSQSTASNCTKQDIIDCQLGRSKEENEDKVKVCLIHGEVGSGRSCLASYLAYSWADMDEKVLSLTDIEATITISAKILSNAKGSLESVLLPLCSLTHGVQNVRKWLQSMPVLVIIDDAEDLNEAREAEVKELTSHSPALSLMLLADPVLSSGLTENWYDLLSLSLRLYGYDREQIFEVSQDYLDTYNSASDYSKLRKFLMKNICRLETVLRFPRCLMQLCHIFASDHNILDEVSTVTDLMWLFTWWNIKNVMKSLPKDAKCDKKGSIWLMDAGKASLNALKANQRLGACHMTSLENATKKIYSSEDAGKLISSIFTIRVYHGDAESGFSSQYPAQEHFLAAWYVGHQVVQGKSLQSVIGRPKRLRQVAVFLGGLISRIQHAHGGSLMELDKRRLVSAVLNHTEDSNEDFDFNLDFVREIKAAPPLLEYIVEGSEYPDEWNVEVANAQLIPLQALLLNVSPTRIFLNVEKYKLYSELNRVIEFLWRVDVWIWLDSATQFRYGDPTRMDRVARHFFNENAVTKVDLLCGCLSHRLLMELPTKPAFSHLVYLKLRVVDFATLCTVLVANRYLPQHLWTEVKIDFPILDMEEEEVRTLPRCTAELFDVHLQGVQDKDVSKLSALLATIHTRYSGIHLHHTSLMPEGIYVLLKRLNKHGVCLQSLPSAVAKFRRWYYPQLSSCDANIELNDEAAIELLGFDDRKYYANHRIHSSCYAVTIDAWNLMTFLEESEEIVHFIYTTDNIAFIKQLDGSVTIEQPSAKPNYLLDQISHY